jgi:hypothetical protein
MTVFFPFFIYYKIEEDDDEPMRIRRRHKHAMDPEVELDEEMAVFL